MGQANCLRQRSHNSGQEHGLSCDGENNGRLSFAPPLGSSAPRSSGRWFALNDSDLFSGKYG